MSLAGGGMENTMNNLKIDKLRNTLQWSLSKVKKYQNYFLLSLLLGFIITALNIIVVPLTEASIRNLSVEENRFLSSILLLIAAIVSQLIVQVIQKYISGKLSANVAYDIKDQYHRKILRLSKRSENQLNSGDVIARFNHEVTMITDFVPNGLYQVFFQLIRGGVAIIYLATVNFTLLLGSVILLPVVMFILKKLQVKMRGYFGKDNECRGKSNIITNETITNIQFVKSYHLEKQRYERIRTFYQESLDHWIHIHKIFSPILMLTIITREFPKFACICFGGWLALSGSLEFEELIGFVMLLDYIIVPITSIPQMMVSITSAGTSIQRYEEIMKLEEERNNGVSVTIDENLETILEVKHVSFGYQPETFVLNDLSFKLRKGEQIAIVGESGSGKSSIMRLLLGDYEVNSGRILMYGQDYKGLSLESIRENIAFVSQDVTMLPLTIRENIALGSRNEAVSEEQIRAAAKLSGASEFIELLPEQYDTVLGDDGMNLSGGQRQMISIARAFLKESSIILLDEPTSALDAESEGNIRIALKKLLKNKSVIIIAHRFSTICDSDTLLILRDGRIIEEGTHTKLLNCSEYYKNLYLTVIRDDRKEVNIS